MNIKALALIALMPLAGCQTFAAVLGGNINNPVTPKVALELDAGFTGGVVVAAAHYNQLARCSATVKFPCSDQKVVNQLRLYINTASGTLDQLDDWANGNSKLDGPALYDAATKAIAAAEKYAAGNGLSFTRETTGG